MVTCLNLLRFPMIRAVHALESKQEIDTKAAITVSLSMNKCHDKCARSRHRKVRQASSDGSHKGAIKADIDEMTTDVDTWRAKVCAKALSDNKQLQEKARDEALQFAKDFHKHQDITRDVFRKVYPLYSKRGVATEFEVTHRQNEHFL